MPHAIAPVLYKVALEEFVVLGADTILQGTRVRKGNLFVPTFLAYGMLTLERIQSGKGNVKGGKSNRNHTVPQTLGQVK